MRGFHYEDNSSKIFKRAYKRIEDDAIQPLFGMRYAFYFTGIS